MDYMAIAVAIASAVFWYKGVDMEKINPLMWAGPSVLISGVAIFALARGWLAVLLGQLALFVAITLWRTLREKSG